MGDGLHGMLGGGPACAAVIDPMIMSKPNQQ
jgi:hypothetical protein